MTPYELKSLAIQRFGARDWLHKLAFAMAVNERTVRRWAVGDIDISPRIESHVRLACAPLASPARGVGDRR